MTNIGKLSWLSFTLAVVVVGIAAQFVFVRHLALEQPTYNTNTGELVPSAMVGQTFVSQYDTLSAVDVMFGTYSGRENVGTIQFELRESLENVTPLRTATVEAGSLGDNQFHTFSFDPVKDAKDKTFLFLVYSLGSRSNAAVTVDVDSRDPYHLGNAVIVRGVLPQHADPAVLHASGKQTIDVAFRAYTEVPLRVAAVTWLRDTTRAARSSWVSDKSTYLLWTWPLVGAVLLLMALVVSRDEVYARLLQTRSKHTLTLMALVILFIVAVIFRIHYANLLPFTNDEGNYVYDARTLLEGRLAGGDGYVKAPLFIAWVAVWQVLFGTTLLGARLSSIMIGAATMVPLYLLARELWTSDTVTRMWIPATRTNPLHPKSHDDLGWGRRIGIVTAALWATAGAAVVFNIYVHTQPLALFFGISGIAVLLMALRGRTPKFTFFPGHSVPSSLGWFVFAGVLLGLAVASRKSMLALGLVPLMMIIVEGGSLKRWLTQLVAVGAGFLVVIALLLTFAHSMYGAEGVIEAMGLNSAEDGIAVVDPDQADQIRAYSLRGMTPFFREALPLIPFALIGLGIMGEQMIRRFFHTETKPRPEYAFWIDHVAPKFVWLIPWAVFVWAWRFFFEYEGSTFMAYGIPVMWYVFGGMLVLATLLPRPREEQVRWLEVRAIPESKQPSFEQPTQNIILTAKQKMRIIPNNITAFLTVPLWIGGLVFFYMNWIKFHANYISEFIPPLVLLAGYGIVSLAHRMQGNAFVTQDYPYVEVVRRVLAVGVAGTLVWALLVSGFITQVHEHTGTFDQRAVEEAAAWAQDNIPIDQPIFTGAALVPYLSGHRTALNIAHPRWYAYEFTRTDPDRLNTFLPSIDAMLHAYRSSEWVLLEKQTGFSFLMEYSEIERGIEADFVNVQGIENGSNTLTFYQRR